MGMKISILYLGKMEFPKFRLVDWKDEGAMVQSPAVAILIQHPTWGIFCMTRETVRIFRRFTRRICSMITPLRR